MDVSADVLALDPFAISAHAVRYLHESGRTPICHLRAGLWEPDRPDASRVEARVIGSTADTPYGSGRWLDIRRWDLLSGLVADRLALCVAKGFGGVVLSALDGYAHPTGFPLSQADQAAYNDALVALARERRLVVGIAVSPGSSESFLRRADFTLTAPT